MIESKVAPRLNLKSALAPLGIWAALAGVIRWLWPKPQHGYGLLFYGVLAAALIMMFALAYWKPSLPLASLLEGQPIVKQLRSTIRNLQQALDRRSLVLAATGNFANWTHYLVENPAQTTFDRVNNSFVEGIRDLFSEVGRIAIFVPTDSGQQLAMTYHSRYEPTRQRTLLVDDSAAGYCYKTGKTHYWPDIAADPDCPYRPFPDSTKISALLCIPVKTPSGKVHAVLSMDSQLPASLNKDKIDMVEVLTRQIGVTWSIWSAYQEGEPL